jgi:hypothetical protein
MPTPDPQPSIIFKTEDGLLTLTFLLGKDPQSPQQDPMVTAELDLFWEQGSPIDPITVEIRLKQLTKLVYPTKDNPSLKADLWLRPTPDGQLAVLGDIKYGQTEPHIKPGRTEPSHHLAGVLALFPLTAS